MSRNAASSGSSDLAFVDDTMSEIRRNWNVTTQDDYNPITVALEMLQRSNPAHEFAAFETLQQKLEQAMEIIVNKYYSGFNSAVSVFGGIVDQVNDSKSEVSRMKNELEAFRDQIQYKRADLPELYSKIGAFKDSAMASRKAVELASSRNKYLELAEQKFFIPAAKLLVQCLAILDEFKIEAAEAHRQVIQDDKKHMTNAMLEELINHLFLKTTGAANNWFSKTFQEMPDLQERIGKLPDDYSLTHVSVTAVSEKDLVMAPAEFDFKPDANSLIYVSSLLQALGILGTLDDCLGGIEQRMSTELFQLVEGHIKTAAERLRKSRLRPETQDKFVLIGTGMSSVSRDEFHTFCPILRELASIITAKLIVIADVFKFVTQAIINMKEDDSYFASVETPVRVAVQAVQREMKSFAMSVLYDSLSSAGSFFNPVADISEILKGSKTRSTVDKSDLFQFDMVSDPAVVSEIMSMSSAVRERDRATGKRIASSLNIDPYATSKKDLGHRQVVKPNIQYLMLLYQPIRLLTETVETLLDKDAASLPSILPAFDQAVEREYIPFVESYMLHELVAAFKGTESSSWADHSANAIKQDIPIGRNASSVLCCYLTFVRLFSQISRLVYFLPNYQAPFERVMEQLCDQLLDKSEVKLRDLILAKFSAEEDLASNLLCLSVQLARNAEIRSILAQNTLLHGYADAQLNRLLAEKETIVMERLKGDRSIGRSELISEPKTLRDLALLQRSFEQLRALLFSGRHSAHQNAQDTIKLVSDESSGMHLHVCEGGRKAVIKMSAAFDAKFSVFSDLLDKLALTCLFTLHCEIRTHCFFYLDLAFREGQYRLDRATGEPDPYVLNLTADLLELSSCLSDWFPLSKYCFLFDGLSGTIDAILVNNFRYIKTINTAGWKKLASSLTALVQILTQILPPSEVSLPAASEYYRLASVDGERLMEEIQASSVKFTFMQYKALLDVLYHDALQQESNEAARRAYMNHITSLKYYTDPRESAPAALTALAAQ